MSQKPHEIKTTFVSRNGEVLGVRALNRRSYEGGTDFRRFTSPCATLNVFHGAHIFEALFHNRKGNPEHNVRI